MKRKHLSKERKDSIAADILKHGHTMTIDAIIKKHGITRNVARNLCNSRGLPYVVDRNGDTRVPTKHNKELFNDRARGNWLI